MSNPLTAMAVSASYGPITVVDQVSLAVHPGEVLAIIGPNGSGKSTLLRTLARIHAPDRGEVRLDGIPIHTQRNRDVARRLAFLPQDPVAPPGLTVRDLVALGRHPHRTWLGGDPHGAQAIAIALHSTGVAELAERPIDALSGGQRQRVWIALALAQGAQLLLLDEPTNHLDPAHRAEVMKTLLRLAHHEGRGIAVVLHDLVLAAATCDRVAVLERGRIAAHGTPSDVLDSDLLQRVYGTPFDILTHPSTGRPVPLQQFGASPISPDANASLEPTL